MSDEKPFAVVATIADNQYAVIVDHRRVMFGNELYVYEESAFLNSAVAARERKAAAQALREAARDFVGHRSGDDEWTAEDVRAWLRSRAAALEGGA